MDVEYVDTIILLEDERPEDYLGVFSNYGGEVTREFHLINAVAVRMPENELYKLEGYDFIRKVELDGEVHALKTETANAYEGFGSGQWDMDNIHAPEAWEAGYTGKGVKVAVIDTGINHKHADLAPNYKGGYDFVNNDDDPLDDNGHGTHCAGSIAANGKIKGVAYEAELYGVKVLNAWGSGSYSGVIAGIEWAVDNGMDIASMSLGGSSGTDALLEACDAARENGTVIVAASGNSGGSVGFPAAYDSCITVGAVDKRNNLASFSSRGPEMDVVAPGVDVYSTYKDGYRKLSGTSMATPHVAGFVALLKQQDMSRGFDDIRTILHETSTDRGEPGFDEKYGYGLIDAIKALGLE